MRKLYPLLDLGKFFASLLIVYIHVPLFLSIDARLNYWVMLVTRIAVPFFFVVSSYLYFEQYDMRNEKRQYRNKWCRNLLKTWILWSVIYLVIRIIEIVYYGFDFLWHCKLIVRDFIFDGISGHLWYIPALLFSVLFVQILLGRFGKPVTWIIAICLFAVGIAGNTYIVFLPEKITVWITKILYCIKYTRNGLFWAPILILCGYELHIKNDKVLNISDKGYVFLIILSAFLMFAEGKMISLVSGSYETLAEDMWFSCIPAATILVAFLIQRSGKVSTDYRFFRVISQYVYLVHLAYIYILQMLLSNTVSIAEASWLYFLVVMILTLITAVVIAKIGDARKIRKQMQVES